MQVPAGAARVDLTGKTVMPTMVDLHGHIGFQNVAEGTMSKETYTRDNLIDHLQLLAYNGVGAVIGVGDLVSRSDLHGGRTNWGDVPLRVRDEVVPGAALFRTAGPGIAWPGSGAQGHPSRMDVSYPVSTVDEARAAVRDYVAMKPLFIKMWVDDRGGTKKTLTPPLYRAVVEEAHKYNVPVGVHNVTLANAKELMRAGVEGWLHVPARGGDEADDELVSIVKDRIARNDRPNIWMTPSLITVVDEHAGRHASGMAGRSAAAGGVFAARYRRALGQPAEEDDRRRGRPRPPQLRVRSTQRDEAASGRDDRRQRHRHRSDAVLDRLSSTTSISKAWWRWG